MTIIRCEYCTRGVHEDDSIHIKATDDVVCPRCYDEWTDAAVEREEAV